MQTTASVVIKDYATANGWETKTNYNTVAADENITLTATGRDNTGKFYDSDNSWRFYAGESGKVTISAKEGYTIVSVKVTYTTKNNGYFLNGEAQVNSDSIINVNAGSIVLAAGGTYTDKGEEKKSSVFITAIEVVYQAA